MACLIPCLRSVTAPDGTFYVCGLDGDHAGDHYDPTKQASFSVDR